MNPSDPREFGRSTGLRQPGGEWARSASATTAGPFPPGAEVLVTTDMLMDGRHFRLGEASPPRSATRRWRSTSPTSRRWRACRSRRSWPSRCPRGRRSRWPKGSTPGWPRSLESVRRDPGRGRHQRLGWPAGRDRHPDRRGDRASGPSDARARRPGDAILVTGPLGGSLLGAPPPADPSDRRGPRPGGSATIHAMIDISDGLAADLATSSRKAAAWGRPSTPPRSRSTRRLGMSRRPLDHALHDGEDFELCLTLSRDDANRLLGQTIPGRHAPPGRHDRSRARAATPAREDGSVVGLAGRGFDHLARAAEHGRRAVLDASRR